MLQITIQRQDIIRMKVTSILTTDRQQGGMFVGNVDHTFYVLLDEADRSFEFCIFKLHDTAFSGHQVALAIKPEGADKVLPY